MLKYTHIKNGFRQQYQTLNGDIQPCRVILFECDLSKDMPHQSVRQAIHHAEKWGMEWTKDGHHYEDIIHGRSVAVDGGLARWQKPQVQKNMTALKSSKGLGRRL